MNNLLEGEAEVIIKKGRRTIQFFASNLIISSDSEWQEPREGVQKVLISRDWSFSGKIPMVDANFVKIYDKPTILQRVSRVKNYLRDLVLGKPEINQDDFALADSEEDYGL